VSTCWLGAQDRHSLNDRKPIGEPLERRDQLGRGRKAVGRPGQEFAWYTVGRDRTVESEPVPALRPPALADLATFKDDIPDAGTSELVADRQPCRPRADDGDVNAVAEAMRNSVTGVESLP
jgi:hypothetical protein